MTAPIAQRRVRVDLDPFGYVHGQVAEQRGGGDVDYVVVDGYVPQVEIEVAEQYAGAERARQPPTTCLPPATQERNDGGDRTRRSGGRRGLEPGGGGS